MQYLCNGKRSVTPMYPFRLEPHDQVIYIGGLLRFWAVPAKHAGPYRRQGTLGQLF